MKRVLLEWGGIAFTFAALGGFAFWIVSLFSPVADFELSFGRIRPICQMSASEGRLMFCEGMGNLELLDLVDQGQLIKPAPVDKTAFSLPGLRYRSVLFEDDFLVWAMDLSCLIPTSLAALLAIACLWRLRALVQNKRKTSIAAT